MPRQWNVYSQASLLSIYLNISYVSIGTYTNIAKKALACHKFVLSSATASIAKIHICTGSSRAIEFICDNENMVEPPQRGQICLQKLKIRPVKSIYMLGTPAR